MARTSCVLLVSAVVSHAAAALLSMPRLPCCAAGGSVLAMRPLRATSMRMCAEGDDVEQDPNAFQVTLVDPDTPGKGIECTMMETAEIGGKLYASMVPRDTPALIATLDADEGVLAEVDDPEELAAVLPLARQACESLGLQLLDSAVSLTLAGDVEAAQEAAEDLEGFDDSELDMADDAEDDEADAAGVVASFTNAGRTFYVMSVSAPLILVGRQESLTNFVIPSEAEMEQIGPLLEFKMRQTSLDEEYDEDDEDWPEA